MSHSKWLLGIAVLTVSFAAQSHRYACPAFIKVGHSRYPFDTLRVFDSPPQDLGELIGVDTRYGAVWDLSENDDPYIICGYKGTKKTITVHAPGTLVCKVINTPTAGYCE